VHLCGDFDAQDVAPLPIDLSITVIDAVSLDLEIIPGTCSIRHVPSSIYPA
jgi:hypothetical protein